MVIITATKTFELQPEKKSKTVQTEGEKRLRFHLNQETTTTQRTARHQFKLKRSNAIEVEVTVYVLLFLFILPCSQTSPVQTTGHSSQETTTSPLDTVNEDQKPRPQRIRSKTKKWRKLRRMTAFNAASLLTLTSEKKRKTSEVSGGARRSSSSAGRACGSKIRLSSSLPNLEGVNRDELTSKLASYQITTACRQRNLVLVSLRRGARKIEVSMDDSSHYDDFL